jgi:hypothetical protein
MALLGHTKPPTATNGDQPSRNRPESIEIQSGCRNPSKNDGWVMIVMLCGRGLIRRVDANETNRNDGREEAETYRPVRGRHRIRLQKKRETREGWVVADAGGRGWWWKNRRDRRWRERCRVVWGLEVHRPAISLTPTATAGWLARDCPRRRLLPPLPCRCRSDQPTFSRPSQSAPGYSGSPAQGNIQIITSFSPPPTLFFALRLPSDFDFPREVRSFPGFVSASLEPFSFFLRPPVVLISDPTSAADRI